MLIRRRQSWEMPEREATPESVFLNRRALLSGAGLLGAGAIAAQFSASSGIAAEAADPSAGLYPAKHNDAFVLDRAVTPEKINSQYNNFYEFGSTKNIASAAQALKTRPWSVKIDGLCDKPGEFGIDDLIAAQPIEERLYRHRCVEAWSMAIPWTGFPLSKLVERAQPQTGAKFVKFETFMDAKTAPGQKQLWYPWPYVEALTMEEAMNDLAFMVTGAYGKPLGKPFGAPLRLATPWKYGFKSIKSITKISFVAARPKTFWEQLQASEYGFWANVNPAVAHPRWSQASEEILGTGERKPTLLFNGYGEQVSGLYKGMEKEAIWF